MPKYKKDPNEITFDELDTLTLEDLGKRSSGCYAFYDWFCGTESLKNKAKRLIGVLRKIVKTKTKAFDPAKCYVFFKNNCPCVGRLYDDLRICDKKSGEVLINICPSKHEIWCRDNDFEKPVTVCSGMKDVYAWFKDRA